MHKHKIRPDVVAYAKARRGRVGLFDHIVPEKTAHIVVDLQNGFMLPDQAVELAAAREVVPDVNRISAALRDAGGTVVYIQNTFDDASLRTWSNFFDHFIPQEGRSKLVDTFRDGSFGHALYGDLDVRPGDLKVNKTRFGAFVPGSSDLHAILTARGIDTLIVTGCATNVCCESTARDAMMMNYKVFFVADATATMNDEAHNATLSALAQTFCDVRDSDAVIGLIQAAKAAPKAAE